MCAKYTYLPEGTDWAFLVSKKSTNTHTEFKIKVQSTLVISTSDISNNRLSRGENLVLVLA